MTVKRSKITRAEMIPQCKLFALIRFFNKTKYFSSDYSIRILRLPKESFAAALNMTETNKDRKQND